MIKGMQPLRGSYLREVCFLMAEFNGRGASNGVCPPVQRSDGNAATKAFTLTRTGAGLYTLAHVNGSIPLGLYREGEIMSSTAQASVYFLTENVTTGVWTISILSAAGAAYDPVAADVIQLCIRAANTGTP